MTKTRITKTGIFILFLAFTHLNVHAQLDSLLSIDQSERDTVWIDNITKASWGVMYSNPREALAALNTAEAFAKARNLNQKLPRLYVNIGIAYDVLDIPDSAMLLYNHARGLAIQLNDSSILASALNNIGLIHWNLNQLDSALYYYIESEALFEAVGNRRGLTSTMNNIGLIYLDQGRNPEARDYFQKVLIQSKVQESDYFESVAYQNIGLTFDFDDSNSSKDKLDSAIYYTELAVPIQIKIENDYGLAKSYHSLASFNSTLRQNEKAIQYCQLAIETNKKIENDHATASNYYQLAGFYIDLNKLDDAVAAINQAANYVSDFDDVELEQKIYQAQVKTVLLITDPDLHRIFSQSTRLIDSLHTVAMQGNIIEMQEAYEAEKRDKEIAVKNAAIQVQLAQIRTQIIVGIISAILLIAIIIWLIARFRYRQRINTLEYNNKMHAEKSRISKDLHDNVGAQLTSIATRIAMAGSQSESDSKTAAQLNQAGSEAKETIDLLRDTIWAMNQEAFTIEAFSNRIQTYAAQHLRDIAQVSVNKTNGIYADLNSNQALNLFRIVQEAIQNTMKHLSLIHI